MIFHLMIVDDETTIKMCIRDSPFTVSADDNGISLLTGPLGT